MTTAEYLAKLMCAERGYERGTVPEAQALADACDGILTKSDGMSLQIICVVDREANPTRTFGLELATVVEIGKRCLAHTGTVFGAKQPVGIQVWEVGPGADSNEARARLKALSRRMPGLAKVQVTAWAIDSTGGHVFSTAPWGGVFMGRRYLERVLAAPRRADHEIVREEPAAVATASRRPWVTISIFAVLALAFTAELVFGVLPWKGLLSPDILTLVAAGGVVRPALQEGEWHRLFTAAFLHGDIIHLVFNGVALFLAGIVLEKLFGRAWLVALFVVGALGGSVLSVIINPPNIVSVGASGAIMALLAAALVSSFRLPAGVTRTQMQMPLVRVLIPSLIPLATQVGGKIDFAAHLGGALVGAAMGLVLLKTWPQTEPFPRFQKVARAVAAAGALLLVVGFSLVAKNYGSYRDVAAVKSYSRLLIPDEQLPKSDSAILANAAALVKKYPRDPRARIFHARLLETEQKPREAESELRRGLEERDILRVVFPNRNVEILLRAFLAELLIADGRKPDAESVASPVCAAGPEGKIPDVLKSLGVCK
ncbi:MAG: rhomboid family intramembrane serine protease [Deltaproteobacteria bacterium]|nr:rhomboid family intramembrane serine protease [Deltaproteobacteria bacterium]